jgi:hypothetical protein
MAVPAGQGGRGHRVGREGSSAGAGRGGPSLHPGSGRALHNACAGGRAPGFGPGPARSQPADAHVARRDHHLEGGGVGRERRGGVEGSGGAAAGRPRPPPCWLTASSRLPCPPPGHILYLHGQVVQQAGVHVVVHAHQQLGVLLNQTWEGGRGRFVGRDGRFQRGRAVRRWRAGGPGGWAAVKRAAGLFAAVRAAAAGLSGPRARLQSRRGRGRGAAAAAWPPRACSARAGPGGEGVRAGTSEDVGQRRNCQRGAPPQLQTRAHGDPPVRAQVPLSPRARRPPASAAAPAAPPP